MATSAKGLDTSGGSLRASWLSTTHPSRRVHDGAAGTRRLHGELLAEVERVHGKGPSARYSILVDDRKTSALRKQLVPLDAWPHHIESIAAGAPTAATPQPRSG